MKRLNNSGAINLWAILLVFSSLLLFLATALAIWGLMERADYKNNSDEKSGIAVTAALADQKIELDAQFAEDFKEPYVSYSSSQALGSVKLTYPKTWSAYIEESNDSSALPVDAYFSPGFVPALNSDASFSLRFQIVDSTIDKELEAYQRSLSDGTVTVNAYRPPNVENARAGYRVDGEILRNRQGSMVLIPVRDKTVKIWTEEQQFIKDLDNIILTNLEFQP